ncbi:hypothetical protein ACJ73_00104 [Blastomyces percursus]|uniref:Xylanolytic transcriptional activator regulatory domain-containing protein n=1 Tax=Blastomyces percursus TaxID=1658174 RepID=A0A1J9QJ39_9EURO|nr:hypothetical protein ACJ73_00104 [Blastomyces percursus]
MKHDIAAASDSEYRRPVIDVEARSIVVTDNAQHAGLPEGYVRGLEKLWALSISNIASLEERILQMLGSKEAESSRSQWLFSLWNNERASERLHEIWKSSELYASVEEMLLNPGLTIFGTLGMEEDRGGIEPERSLSDIASDSQLDDCSRPSCWRKFTMDIDSISTYTTTISWQRRTKNQVSYLSQTAERNSRMKLPMQTSQLLDMYFAHTHSWFPILAKREILKASYQYIDPSFKQQAPLKFNYGNEVQKPRRRRERVLCGCAKPDTGERGKFEIGHVQAALLLTLVNIGFGDWTAAWILCGQATSVAIDLGFRDASRGTQSPRQSKQEETFLGCFLLDTLLSARLARCPRMSSDTIHNADLLEEDGLEEWSPWVDVFLLLKLHEGGNPCPRGPLRSCSTFNRLIELSKFLHILWDNVLVAPDVTAMAHETFLRNLKHWETKLPPGCRLSDVSKKMLLGHGYHTLSLLTYQSENFTQTYLPPLFEFPLRVIIDTARSQALSRHKDASWFESVASQISRAGGTATPSFPILDPASTRSNLASPYPHCSSPHSGSVYDILESLESFLQGDADTQQPNEEVLAFFSPIFKAPMDQFSSSDYRSSGEASTISSSQDFEDGWAGLQSPNSTAQAIPWMTPTLSKTRGENTPPLPRSHRSTMCTANQEGTHHRPQPLNGGYTLGPQNATPQFPNHKGSSPASVPPPAPNDIESIFHDLPTPNNSDISPSKPQKAFLTRALNYDSSHARLIVDIYDDKSSHDTLLNNHDDDGSTENSAEEFQKQKQDDRMEEGTGKQPLPNKIMRPPSIADIWPPPGFFPDTFGEDSEGDVGEAGEKMDDGGQDMVNRSVKLRTCNVCTD